MKHGAGSVPEDVKIPKLAVAYQPPLPKGLSTPRGRGRTCSTCFWSFFAPGAEQGGCFVVAGPIHRQSYCHLWNYTGVLNLNFEDGEKLAARLRALEPYLTRAHRR